MSEPDNKIVDLNRWRSEHDMPPAQEHAQPEEKPSRPETKPQRRRDFLDKILQGCDSPAVQSVGRKQGFASRAEERGIGLSGFVLFKKPHLRDRLTPLSSAERIEIGKALHEDKGLREGARRLAKALDADEAYVNAYLSAQLYPSQGFRQTVLGLAKRRLEKFMERSGDSAFDRKDKIRALNMELDREIAYFHRPNSRDSGRW